MRRYAALLALLWGCSDTPSEPTPVSPKMGLGVSVGSYIVILKSGSAPSNAKRKFSHVFNGYSVEMSESQAEALRHNPNVKSVSEEETFTVNATWGLDRIDQRSLPLSNSYSPPNSGSGVTAYIVDTGIMYSHPEFQGRALFGWDMSGLDGSDCMGHGTHVSGTVGGITYGVAKSVSLVAVKVFPGCSGSTESSSVIAGLDWVAAHATRPAVVNMSLSGPVDPAMDAAVANLTSLGVVVVVAAGNETSDACFSSPARAPSAITVGASDANDLPALFSNSGRCVDLYAPGVGVVSAWIDGGAKALNGTSMASPHVAGVAALILSANPSLSVSLVDSVIYARSTKGVIGGDNLLFSGLTDDGNTVPPPPYVPPDSIVPPVAPSGLSYSVLSYGSGKNKTARVRFQWVDNSDNESGFRVLSGNVSIYAPANATSVDADLPLGTWNTIVRAFSGTDSDFPSAWSNQITVILCSKNCGTSPAGHR